MFWLFILGIIVIIVLLSNTGKKKDLERTSQLSARNQQWIDFVIGYGAVALFLIGLAIFELQKHSDNK